MIEIMAMKYGLTPEETEQAAKIARKLNEVLADTTPPIAVLVSMAALDFLLHTINEKLYGRVKKVATKRERET